MRADPEKERLWMKRISTAIALATTTIIAFGCSKHSEQASGDAKTSEQNSVKTNEGTSAIIAIDGSSTVFPITEAIAEEFQKVDKSRVTIGVSGTGGGFKKFCKNEAVITGASRPIKPSEVELCSANQVEYIELPVAYDGISVVIHPDNTWVDSLTVEELKRMWEPEAQGKITKWSQIRTGWPEKELHLFGAGVDSGTYDYFTMAIVGVEHKSRGDFTSSEDDNVLVQGVSTDPLALGFFGFAYYSENSKKVKAVPIDDGDEATGKGGIAPSVESVANGTYQPLARPIFIYVSKQGSTRPEVKAFVDYYISKGEPLVKEAGYIPLGKKANDLVLARFKAGTTGSLFDGKGSKVGATVEELLASK